MTLEQLCLVNWNADKKEFKKMADKNRYYQGFVRRFQDAEDARAVGITANTLLRWQKVPEFATAYREATRAACAQSTARLQQASSAAVSTLLKVMIDPATPPALKFEPRSASWTTPSKEARLKTSKCG